jgi:hypothetical protein
VQRERGRCSDVLDVGGRQLVDQQCEEGPRKPFRINAGVATDALMKSLQKSLTCPCRRGTPRAPPAFEVEAADKRRERDAEMDGVVLRQAIAKGVKRSEECTIGWPSFAPDEACHEVGYPLAHDDHFVSQRGFARLRVR